MLQLLYISSSRPGTAIDLDALLAQAQRNNRRDAITGLLFTDGRRFLQVLEGPQAAVEKAFERIAADTRHRAIVELSRRDIATREFGEWSMARRGLDEDCDGFLQRIDDLCRDADASVRGTFEGLIRARRAA